MPIERDVARALAKTKAFKQSRREPNRSFRLVLESHAGTALVPIPKRSASRERHRHCFRG
jgi:hypothetical protein